MENKRLSEEFSNQINTRDIFLYILQGKDYEEIAEILGVKYQSIKNYVKYPFFRHSVSFVFRPVSF